MSTCEVFCCSLWKLAYIYFSCWEYRKTNKKPIYWQNAAIKKIPLPWKLLVSWGANLRVNLFSTGLFSSSELSSVGKQRRYKQQGGVDSETQLDTNRCKQNKNKTDVREQRARTEKHRIKEQRRRRRRGQSTFKASTGNTWSVSSTLLMVLKQVLATCCRQVYASLIYRTALPQEYPH